MPQCKNIPEGKKGWTKIKCPICGELCWKRPLQDETIHKVKAEGGLLYHLCHENEYEYEINRKEVK